MAPFAQLVAAVALLGAPTSVDKLSVTVVKLTASEQQAALSRLVKNELQPLKGCYDLALKGTPDLAGELELGFRFEENVIAEGALTEASPLKDETAAQCMVARMRTMKLPRLRSGATMTVRLLLKR